MIGSRIAELFSEEKNIFFGEEPRDTCSCNSSVSFRVYSIYIYVYCKIRLHTSYNIYARIFFFFFSIFVFVFFSFLLFISSFFPFKDIVHVELEVLLEVIIIQVLIGLVSKEIGMLRVQVIIILLVSRINFFFAESLHHKFKSPQNSSFSPSPPQQNHKKNGEEEIFIYLGLETQVVLGLAVLGCHDLLLGMIHPLYLLFLPPSSVLSQKEQRKKERRRAKPLSSPLRPPMGFSSYVYL